MITHRSLRFALFIFFLMAPLATLTAQGFDLTKGDGLFYVSAVYGVALPTDRKINEDTISTDTGMLGGQIGVGYAILGLRPELSASYRTVNIKNSNGVNSVTSVDIIPSVYYDIGMGNNFIVYMGVGGGISQVTVKQPGSKSALALTVQGSVGIGYDVTEEMIFTLGYRLTGTASADFPEEKAERPSRGLSSMTSK